jgi:hypothetical protein
MTTELVTSGTTTVSTVSSTTYIVLAPGTLDIASGGRLPARPRSVPAASS